MEWTPRDLSAATGWSPARCEGWLSAVADAAANRPASDYRDIEEFLLSQTNEFGLETAAARRAFGYVQAVQWLDAKAISAPAAWSDMAADEMIKAADGEYPMDEQGTFEAGELDWKVVESFPLDGLISRMPGGRKEWGRWFRAQCDASIDAHEDGYGHMVAGDSGAPIVLSLEENGQWLRGGSWLRVAAAIVRGDTTCLALVGEPRPSPAPGPG